MWMIWGRGFERISAATGTQRAPDKMGPVSDPEAVVDSRGRVHGVDGLRVVDASIFPSMPRANTNIPTIAAAEFIAASMQNETHER